MGQRERCLACGSYRTRINDVQTAVVCVDCTATISEIAPPPSVAEKRRFQGCCIDCGRKYGDEYGFPDLVVPNDVWTRISPTGDEGGLLCPSCLCRRAYDAGLRDVRATFRSGPFAERSDATPEPQSSRRPSSERGERDTPSTEG